LWGTSFAGGHVLVTAAKEAGISAVIAQVPFVDGLDFARAQGLKYVAQAVGSGLRDVVRLVISGKRWKVPVVGNPGTFAVLNTPDSKSGYLTTMVPQGSQWKNECPAAFLLTGPFYRPTRYAARIPCPALVIWAEKDSIISAKSVKKAAEKIKDVRMRPLPIAHFDIYIGDVFEQAVRMQVEFLKENL
jgi:pimeloyl-ACP methyl ester carboxylesterase